jgi:hypothetical protein
MARIDTWWDKNKEAPGETTMMIRVTDPADTASYEVATELLLRQFSGRLIVLFRDSPLEERAIVQRVALGYLAFRETGRSRFEKPGRPIVVRYVVGQTMKDLLAAALAPILGEDNGPEFQGQVRLWLQKRSAGLVPIIADAPPSEPEFRQWATRIWSTSVNSEP